MGGTAKLARAHGGSRIAHPRRGSQNRGRRRQARHPHPCEQETRGDVFNVVITGRTGVIGQRLPQPLLQRRSLPALDGAHAALDELLLLSAALPAAPPPWG